MEIDFVVLWVDGNDPAWQEEKRLYSGETVDDSNAVYRFRDWGLMKYWFRAVEAYTPWVRKIHFVTWGHLPPFLNTENPRLHIVRHTDYLPAEALPTFNANALEMNLHRIEGLAEHFVYFNDDAFLCRPLPPDDFFDEKTGLPRAQFSETPCIFTGRLAVWQTLYANCMGVVNQHFPKRDAPKSRYLGQYCSRRYPLRENVRNLAMKALFPGYYTGLKGYHAPTPCLKQTFEAAWAAEPDLLRQTTCHRFRHREDVSQLLIYWWQLLSGTFAPYCFDNAVEDITPESVRSICDAIEKHAHKMICLNDPSGEIDFETLSARLNAAFEKTLPDKCSFEK